MLPRLLALTLLAAAIAITAAAPAAAQDQPTEFPSWRLPGWTFTPGIMFGGVYDSNVAIASAPAPGAKPATDRLWQARPFTQLEFISPRTTFSSGYQGSLRRYLEFDNLDSFEHRAYVSLRERITRRVTFYLTDNFLRLPTTDQLPLNGVPFQRNGSRYNAFATGIESRLSRSLDLNARYDMTWVDFDRKDTLLRGGFVNGGRVSLAHRFTERSSLGGEYGLRLSSLDEGTRTLAFQEAGAVYRYDTGPQTTFEAAAGYARLRDRIRDVTRDGPYARVGLTHRAERATFGVDFEHSFVPSVSFGGANQSQELRGYIQMPLSRNRFYVQEAAAWRRTDPFVDVELPLDSIWINSTIGYALQRWLRLEGYHTFTRQDTRLTAGQINRHLIGVQVVVSEPVRIR